MTSPEQSTPLREAPPHWYHDTEVGLGGRDRGGTQRVGRGSGARARGGGGGDGGGDCLTEAAAAAAWYGVVVRRDLSLDLGAGLFDVGLQREVLAGSWPQRRWLTASGLGLLGVEESAFLGQFDAIGLEAGDDRADIACGELVVDVGGTDVGGIGVEEGIVGGGRPVGDVGEDGVGLESRVVGDDLALDARDDGLGVGDGVDDLGVLEVREVVLLAEVLHLGADALDLAYRSAARCFS